MGAADLIAQNLLPYADFLWWTPRFGRGVARLTGKTYRPYTELRGPGRTRTCDQTVMSGQL
jgi:hypothetical protein